MAGMSPLGYRPGSSLLHRLDPRLKLGAMAALSVLSLGSGWPGLFLLSVVLVVLAADARFSLAAFISSTRWVMVLLLLIILSRALFTPGAVFFRWGPVAVSIDGLSEGGLVSWRLLCVMLSAALVIAATPVEMLAAAVTWFLRPLPGVNEHRVGIQLALVIRFIPLILRKAEETRDAQRARCVDHRRRPVERLRLMVVPLLRRVLISADRMALAMAARCYSEPRTRPPMTLGLPDAVAAIVLSALSLAMIAL